MPGLASEGVVKLCWVRCGVLGGGDALEWD